MPRFAANLKFLFTEWPFFDRFERAARAGFSAVEYQFPYEFDSAEVAGKLKHHSLEMVLINLAPGDLAAGDLGLASDPNRRDEFVESVDEAVEYANSIGCSRLNCLAGRAEDGKIRTELEQTLVTNLRYAAEQLQRSGKTLLLEAINTRDVPGYFVSTPGHARSVIDQVGAANLKFQFDVYHVQMMQGDLLNTLSEYSDLIAHIQIADNPGRHEPGTGAIDFPSVFKHIDAMGYDGWVSCEYAPSTNTESSLGWWRDMEQ